MGSGGREHGLAWRLAQSPGLTKLFASPGNPGIAEHAECVALPLTDHDAVVAYCAAQTIGFVVIGPEAPLVDGLGDSLRAAGIGVFGPARSAAQLEGSKGFTKDLCAREGIPTAGYVRVATLAEARAAVANFGLPVAIKADGLAAGKGVTIATSAREAEAALAALFPGGEAVIEAFLTGEEVSLFVLTDGRDILPFGSAQDHKRVGEGDTGPNTGGMGAYSPARVLTPELERQALEEIVRPTVAALARDGMPFQGVLFAGLMLTDAGPQLIEYNARFGDPECEVLMMRFRGDLLALLRATDDGTLAEQPAPDFAEETALTVVLAANGYPGTPQTGGRITGLDVAEATGAKVFQAGTRAEDGNLVSNGGRVLAVTATGRTVAEAQAGAYRAIAAINFPTSFHRRDIGWREIAREG